jgi:hypothetical protein
MDINNNKFSDINRGVEVILKGGNKKQIKSFQIIFEKIICFFNRETIIYFEFYLDSKKKK